MQDLRAQIPCGSCLLRGHIPSRIQCHMLATCPNNPDAFQVTEPIGKNLERSATRIMTMYCTFSQHAARPRSMVNRGRLRQGISVTDSGQTKHALLEYSVAELHSIFKATFAEVPSSCNLRKLVNYFGFRYHSLLRSGFPILLPCPLQRLFSRVRR
jgi:hypothetical protein